MGKVRIIGGKYRSRNLYFIDGVAGLRPTPDRVRETLFNWLGQDLTGKVCLDLFAGSGALGFEAVSRGAKLVTQIEINKEIINKLKQNKQFLKIDNLDIVQQDSIIYLSHLKNSVDIIFLDPPYDTDLLTKCLKVIADSHALFKDTLLYIEYREIPELTNYKVLKTAKAGAVGYALIQLL